MMLHNRGQVKLAKNFFTELDIEPDFDLDTRQRFSLDESLKTWFKGVMAALVEFAEMISTSSQSYNRIKKLSELAKRNKGNTENFEIEATVSNSEKRGASHSQKSLDIFPTNGGRGNSTGSDIDFGLQAVQLEKKEREKSKRRYVLSLKVSDFGGGGRSSTILFCLLLPLDDLPNPVCECGHTTSTSLKRSNKSQKPIIWKYWVGVSRSSSQVRHLSCFTYSCEKLIEVIVIVETKHNFLSSDRLLKWNLVEITAVGSTSHIIKFCPEIRRPANLTHKELEELLRKDVAEVAIVRILRVKEYGYKETRIQDLESKVKQENKQKSKLDICLDRDMLKNLLQRSCYQSIYIRMRYMYGPIQDCVEEIPSMEKCNYKSERRLVDDAAKVNKSLIEKKETNNKLYCVCQRVHTQNNVSSFSTSFHRSSKIVSWCASCIILNCHRESRLDEADRESETCMPLCVPCHRYQCCCEASYSYGHILRLLTFTTGHVSHLRQMLSRLDKSQIMRDVINSNVGHNVRAVPSTLADNTLDFGTSLPLPMCRALAKEADKLLWGTPEVFLPYPHVAAADLNLHRRFFHPLTKDLRSRKLIRKGANSTVLCYYHWDVGVSSEAMFPPMPCPHVFRENSSRRSAVAYHFDRQSR
ncbi:hypothetical protein GQR58_002504 [Nymphon striatum]|nr:hypothetical protein GQR58_002504 [Nymphon striatum]